MAQPVNAGGYADYELENMQLERRRKMAEAMGQGGPVAAGSMVGNHYVPTSWTQHLAAALSKPLSAISTNEIDRQQKELSQRKQSEMSAETKRFAELLGGKPAQQSTHIADDQLAYGGLPSDSVVTDTSTAAVPGDRRAAIAMALEAKNPALQQYGLSALTKEDEIKAYKAGDVLYRNGRRIEAIPEKPEFGTTPQYEKDQSSPTGFVAVLYGKNGERKVIGPANPMNQFTTGTVDAANSQALKLYEFQNLSQKDRLDLDNKARQLGISAQELFFNTGMGYTPQGATAPPNAPPPTAIPTAAQPQQMPQRVVAPGQGGVNPNNFGNIRPVGASTGFQQFDTPEAGLKAIDDNLKAYGAKGINTIAGVINRWAPPSENNTQAYVAAVAQRLGIKPDQPLDMNNPAVRQALGTAIMLHEKGPQAIFAAPGGAPPQVAPRAVPAPSGMTPKAVMALNAENASQNVQRTRDADAVLPILDQAEKIIGGGHGSGVGNILGGVSNFTGLGLGQTSKNAVDAQMKVLSGALVSKMPKMSGPQSDKDVLLYKEMAGQIGDAALPIEVRRAAMKEVRRLNEKYATPATVAEFRGAGASGGWGGEERRAGGAVRKVDW